jgi:hypothetical protein
MQQADALHTQQESSKPRSTLHVSDYTFYLDSDDLDVDIMVNPYEMPSLEIVEKLLDCHMEIVHSSFPIIPDVFIDQFRNYSRLVKQDRLYRDPEHH